MASLRDFLIQIQCFLASPDFLKLSSVNKKHREILSFGNLPYKDKMFYERSKKMAKCNRLRSKVVFEANFTSVFIARDAKLFRTLINDENRLDDELSEEVSRANDFTEFMFRNHLYNPERGLITLREFSFRYNYGDDHGEEETLSIRNITIQYPYP
jgi:hypothetical protein